MRWRHFVIPVFQGTGLHLGSPALRAGTVGASRQKNQFWLLGFGGSKEGCCDTPRWHRCPPLPSLAPCPGAAVALRALTVPQGENAAHNHPVIPLDLRTPTLIPVRPAPGAAGKVRLLLRACSGRVAPPSPAGAAPAFQQPRADPAATGPVLLHGESSASPQEPGETLFC